jgi:hypothetical protein
MPACWPGCRPPVWRRWWPPRRCQQLAQALQDVRPDVRFDTGARLAEMNFGAWEGQRWDALPPALARMAHYKRQPIKEFVFNSGFSAAASCP